MEYQLSKNGYLLRAPEPKDLKILMEFENSSEQFVENCEKSGPYSQFQMRNYLANSTNNLYQDNQLRMMIENKDHVVVGIVDICSFNPYSNRAEIGITISKEIRKQGVGELVLKLFENHCFNNLDIHMLYAYISVENIPSLRLFKKCGYSESAHLKDWAKIKGKYHDVIMVQKINIK